MTRRIPILALLVTSLALGPAGAARAQGQPQHPLQKDKVANVSQKAATPKKTRQKK